MQKTVIWIFVFTKHSAKISSNCNCCFSVPFSRNSLLSTRIFKVLTYAAFESSFQVVCPLGKEHLRNFYLFHVLFFFSSCLFHLKAFVASHVIHIFLYFYFLFIYFTCCFYFYAIIFFKIFQVLNFVSVSNLDLNYLGKFWYFANNFHFFNINFRLFLISFFVMFIIIPFKLLLMAFYFVVFFCWCLYFFFS